jgi:hypothetical protein
VKVSPSMTFVTLATRVVPFENACAHYVPQSRCKKRGSSVVSAGKGPTIASVSHREPMRPPRSFRGLRQLHNLAEIPRYRDLSHSWVASELASCASPFFQPVVSL